jgi:hypothetical protein
LSWYKRQWRQWNCYPKYNSVSINIVYNI